MRASPAADATLASMTAFRVQSLLVVLLAFGCGHRRVFIWEDPQQRYPPVPRAELTEDPPHILAKRGYRSIGGLLWEARLNETVSDAGLAKVLAAAAKHGAQLVEIRNRSAITVSRSASPSVTGVSTVTGDSFTSAGTRASSRRHDRLTVQLWRQTNTPQPKSWAERAAETRGAEFQRRCAAGDVDACVAHAELYWSGWFGHFDRAHYSTLRLRACTAGDIWSWRHGGKVRPPQQPTEEDGQAGRLRRGPLGSVSDFEPKGKERSPGRDASKSQITWRAASWRRIAMTAKNASAPEPKPVRWSRRLAVGKRARGVLILSSASRTHRGRRFVVVVMKETWRLARRSRN